MGAAAICRRGPCLVNLNVLLEPERGSLLRAQATDPGEALFERPLEIRRVAVAPDGGEHPPAEEAVEGVRRGRRRPLERPLGALLGRNF